MQAHEFCHSNQLGSSYVDWAGHQPHPILVHTFLCTHLGRAPATSNSCAHIFVHTLGRSTSHILFQTLLRYIIVWLFASAHAHQITFRTHSRLEQTHNITISKTTLWQRHNITISRTSAFPKKPNKSKGPVNKWWFSLSFPKKTKKTKDLSNYGVASPARPPIVVAQNLWFFWFFWENSRKSITFF